MWCPQCQADVATEVSADGKRLLCTICGEEVRKAFAGSQHPETQSARELLDRWSKSDFLESYGAVAAQALGEDQAEEAEEQQPEVTAPEAPVAAAPVISTIVPALTKAPNPPAITPPPVGAKPAAPAAVDRPRPVIDDELDEEDTGADLLPSPRSTEKPAERPVRKIHRGARPAVQRSATPPREQSAAKPAVQNWRVDAAHADAPTKAASPAVAAPRADFREQSPKDDHAIPYATVERRDDQPHLTAPAPHFDLSSFATGQKPGRHESIFGQLLAYLGVGLLTVGTALVVWGYFGGAAVQKYQSTGWLISTAGQMLLFLGVVTLVSGGMQQTTHEVAQRVEYLGGRMLRIEQSTQELLKGPHFARSGAESKAAKGRADDSQHA